MPSKYKMPSRNKKRTGVAAVEAACCLPLLALICLASIEVSGGIFHEYNAQASAYELSKLALLRSTTSEDLQTFAGDILPSIGFETYSISVDVQQRSVNAASVEPATVTSFSVPQTGATTSGLEEIPRGTLLKLTLTADRPSISGVGAFGFLGNQIEVDCVFVKEF